jgi:hypothetical protein
MIKPCSWQISAGQASASKPGHSISPTFTPAPIEEQNATVELSAVPS